MMKSPSICRNFQAKQRGVGLAAAIFIITVMAAIAAGVFALVDQNADTYAEEVNLARAFYAAESGAGFAMNTIFPPEDYPAYTATTPRCGITTTYNFISDGLNQCSAVVSCSSITNGTSPVVTYSTIQSTGTCGDVSRTVQIRTA
jgi:MSHA biogenesis protein MshP